MDLKPSTSISRSKSAAFAPADIKKKQKPISFQKMAAIQEELSRIEQHLDSLKAKDSNVDVQTDLSAEEIIDPAVVHMLMVELCQLVASGDAVGVKILLEGGADPNTRDYDDRTLLHIACATGKMAVTNLLLEWGADYTIVDREGKTCLDLAEENGHMDIVQVLCGYMKRDRGGGVGDTAIPSSEAESDAEESVQQPDFSSVPQPMVGSLIVVMVGLPGRGKTYVAQQIRRYFQWNGLASTIFTHQVYKNKERSRMTGTGEECTSRDMEMRIAHQLAKDLTTYVNHTGGVAILDGTQTTHARRRALIRAIKDTKAIRLNRVIFVEIVNNDKELVHQNILHAKEIVPNAPDDFVEQYYAILAKHEAVYKSMNAVNDGELSYIRIEDNSTYSLNMITGWMPTRLAYMLHNLSHSPNALYLTRAGEYTDMVSGRIGGNSRLTERGLAYAQALYAFFRTEIRQPNSLNVMTSCARRCAQTVAPFAMESLKKYKNSPLTSDVPVELDCRVSYFPTLDDINHGDCEGQLLSDVKRTMPSTLQAMRADPYDTAWPNGECIHQVFNSRLEPHIHDIQASTSPVLVVSHLHLIQGLYSYFVTEENKVVAPQHAYKIEIPSECVIKIHLKGVNRVAEVIDLSAHVDSILETSNNGLSSCSRIENEYNHFRRYN